MAGKRKSRSKNGKQAQKIRKNNTDKLDITDIHSDVAKPHELVIPSQSVVNQEQSVLQTFLECSFAPQESAILSETAIPNPTEVPVEAIDLPDDDTSLKKSLDCNNNNHEHTKDLPDVAEIKSSTKTIFITVGTTKFDELIEKILEEEIMKILNQLNYTHLVIQAGRSTFKVSCDSADTPTHQIKTEVYQYKPSLSEDIEMADLVVGHAGAGTCLEVLRRGKKLLVVINRDLMDNHQLELAQQLSDDKYLLSCDVSNLKESLIEISKPDIKFNTFPQQNTDCMANILDEVLTSSH